MIDMTVHFWRKAICLIKNADRHINLAGKVVILRAKLGPAVFAEPALHA